MEGDVDLGTFAELGVALVGFAALIAVFRGGSISSWHPRARLAFWYIIAHGLGALFFSLLPAMLVVFHPVSWPGALASLGFFHGFAYGSLLRRHLALVREGIPTPNPWYYWMNGALTSANVVVLGSGATGWLGGPPEAMYLFGIASCILLAALAFAAVLRLQEPPAAQHGAAADKPQRVSTDPQ